jgi:penicillin-insensitive murein endopeptidase
LVLVAWLLLGAGSGSAAGARALSNPWADIEAPAPGAPRIIGGYAAGCIQGAVAMPADDGAYQLMRTSRRRHFAHPDLVALVRRLGQEVERRSYGKLLVGDLGQARGGPTTTGHASHQTGLDGDLWFWLDSEAVRRPLTADEREHLSAISMLDEEQTAVDRQRFRDKHVELLAYVAAQPEIERVFVHPAIKKALCRRTGEAAWLSKIRPWWGHHYHFHVRLKCPQGQADCRPQAPPAQDPGCGADLEWWFSAEAAEKARKAREESLEKTPEERLAARLSRVPAQCRAMLR